jgi:hypothetical protein
MPDHLFAVIIVSLIVTELLLLTKITETNRKRVPLRGLLHHVD